jgi:hypothetical protein
LLSPEAVLAHALNRVFPEQRQANTYHLADIRTPLLGNYMMYRPHWRSSLESTLIQTSMIEITDTIYGLEINEIQDFPAGTTYYYYQKDKGVVFPYGKYIYYLTRELGGGPDQSTVKLGLIKGLLTTGGAVQSFYGMVFGSSNLHIYPAAKFFCRRIANSIKSDVRKLIEISDPEAKQYLEDPIVMNMPRE